MGHGGSRPRPQSRGNVRMKMTRDGARYVASYRGRYLGTVSESREAWALIEAAKAAQLPSKNLERAAKKRFAAHYCVCHE